MFKGFMQYVVIYLLLMILMSVVDEKWLTALSMLIPLFVLLMVIDVAGEALHNLRDAIVDIYIEIRRRSGVAKHGK